MGDRNGKAKRLCILPILSCALLTNAPAQGLDTTDYFPLNVGDTRVYYQSLPCPPDTVRQRIGPWTVRRVVDTTIIDGRRYFLSEGSSEMVRVDSVNNVIVRRSGLEQVYYNTKAAVGDTWSYTATAGDRQYVYRVTMQSRTDTVRVHAGTFTRCLRIYFDIPGSIDDEYTVWLAPNVGTVFQCSWEPLELYEATLNGLHYPLVRSVDREPNPIVSFTLYQNYPNPFNPETVIRYVLKTHGRVQLRVLDIIGREVALLVSDRLSPGSYEATWNGKDSNGGRVASGTYIYQLTVDNYQISKKLLLTR